MSGLLIPPTRLVRRERAKRWHLQRDAEAVAAMIAAGETPSGATVTECGQTIRTGRSITVRNARRIDCYECLTSALSRRLGERAARERATG